MFHRISSALVIGILLFCSSALACTQFLLVAKDGSIVIARTMEFGPDLNSHILTSPVGTAFKSPTPESPSGGLSWNSKYSYIKMDFLGSKLALDGMNEQGLSVGFLYLPGYTKYQTVPAGQEKKALAYIYAGDWVLGNFATVQEVMSEIKNVFVFAEPITHGEIKDVVFPVHMIVADSSGKSIVIEWVNGETNVYENPLGVLTNSPEFPWHLDNIKNYVNISPYSPDPLTLDGIEYSATGQGSGAVGIPGDFTPPSRFVKILYLLQSSFSAQTGQEAVNLAEHIMNNVDIPVGAVQGEKGAKGDLPDKTQWTVFKDLTNKKLYFKSYENTALQVIDFNKLDLSKGSPTLNMPIESKQIIVDVTNRFLESAE